jgi:hypothetical protein
LSIALSTQQQSVMQTLAANTAAEMIGRRRAAPHANNFQVEGQGSRDLLIPKLEDISGTSYPVKAIGEPQVVDTTGFTVEGGQAADADTGAIQFICEYRGWRDARSSDEQSGPKTGNNLYYIHLRFLWPVAVARVNPAAAESYEVLTMITEK